MNLDDWPDCPVEGCTNKICLALNSDRCFPRTPGNEHVKRWRIDARNAPPKEAMDDLRDKLFTAAADLATEHKRR